MFLDDIVRKFKDLQVDLKSSIEGFDESQFKDCDMIVLLYHNGKILGARGAYYVDNTSYIYIDDRSMNLGEISRNKVLVVQGSTVLYNEKLYTIVRLNDVKERLETGRKYFKVSGLLFK